MAHVLGVKQTRNSSGRFRQSFAAFLENPNCNTAAGGVKRAFLFQDIEMSTSHKRTVEFY
jgi:hypothetical protein